jgi:hypothetical protein
MGGFGKYHIAFRLTYRRRRLVRIPAGLSPACRAGRHLPVAGMAALPGHPSQIATIDAESAVALDSLMDETPESHPSPRLPWDFHPALSEDRLRLCARLLANARRDALALAAYEMGDDSWSVGCRAYAFGRHRLLRVAESGSHNWLRVLDDSHHFVFLIEDVPVRFYRGPADDPTARTLRRQEVEARQLGLALGDDVADGLVFRLAVETTATAGWSASCFSRYAETPGTPSAFGRSRSSSRRLR